MKQNQNADPDDYFALPYCSRHWQQGHRLRSGRKLHHPSLLATSQDLPCSKPTAHGPSQSWEQSYAELGFHGM